MAQMTGSEDCWVGACGAKAGRRGTAQPWQVLKGSRQVSRKECKVPLKDLHPPIHLTWHAPIAWLRPAALRPLPACTAAC